MAAAQGASVVLAARNRLDLNTAVAEIRRRGGRAIAIPGDVADPVQVESIATAPFVNSVGSTPGSTAPQPRSMGGSLKSRLKTNVGSSM